MKKLKLSLFLVVGCNKKETKGTMQELKQLQEEIQDKVMELDSYNGISRYGIDSENMVIVVAFVVNDEEHQKWFRDNISDSKYIVFEQGGPYTTSDNIKIEVVKNEIQNLNKYNIYLERDQRTVFISSTIKEVYLIGEVKDTLKNYISTTWQTTDDGMNKITDLLNNIETLRDGGTKIYKSKEYNITIIKCNTMAGTHDYFIGDYNMSFDSDSMCKR